MVAGFEQDPALLPWVGDGGSGEGLAAPLQDPRHSRDDR